jgi:hypothetical protein
LAAVQTELTFAVLWSGADATSGVLGYDIQFKDGEAGGWTDWVTHTSLVSATFVGAEDHTYYFRCRSTDQAGNVEAWPTEADTWTTIDHSTVIYLPLVLHHQGGE